MKMPTNRNILELVIRNEFLSEEQKVEMALEIFDREKESGDNITGLWISLYNYVKKERNK